MLQRTKATRRLESDLNGIEVEGTIMDVLLATNYLCKSNPMIYEAMTGIPILKTPASDELTKLWIQGYNWEI